GMEDDSLPSQDSAANALNQDTAMNASGAPASRMGTNDSSESIQPVGLVGAAGAAPGGGTEMGMTPAAGGAPSMAAPQPSPLDAKFVGNISTRGQIRSDFPMYWNEFSPENEGKWGTVEPNEGTFNWGALDREYAFARQNNIIFKEHNFIWGKQQPGWVTNDNAQAAVQTWMNEFCQRYPEVKVIDVVNEPPPHTTPTYIDGLGGTGASGYDWIANAFKMARQACPSAILLLNDYNNIELDGDNNHTIDILTRIKAAGAPVDGVGAQSHGLANATSANVQRRIDNIMTRTGVPVYITEFDLNIADDQKQMSVMQDLFTMFWNDPNVKGITLWGYIEGSTWETNTGLMTADGQMRPAMSWLMNFLGRP
ncbi:MAG TPA: endo-1,4-beta-xylanase, partial [Polyangiaceae bacterium]|nr:endo-1,4-beta-xylanase [Polyangiaceae bacterium]